MPLAPPVMSATFPSSRPIVPSRSRVAPRIRASPIARFDARPRAYHRMADRATEETTT
jgi:hypothetical protein